MHLEHASGFFPVRVTLLLTSWGLAACGGGGNPLPPNPPTKAPVALNDVATTLEDTAVVIPAATLVSNDTGAEGESLSVTVVGAATHGTATLAGGGVTFTPEENFHGAAAAEYAVCDGASISTSTVTVTVHAVNDAPVAVADAIVADEGGELLVPVATLLANDTDVEGDALTVRQVANARSGKVVLDGDAVQFTLAPGYVGAASFDYLVSDTHGATATGAVALRVRAYAPRTVVAEAGHTCALFPDGRVKYWGGNFLVQLGLGLVGRRGDDPGEVGPRSRSSSSARGRRRRRSVTASPACSSRAAR